MLKKIENQKIKLGNFGEELACRFLAGAGYKILYKNYREGFDEIDIIARSKDLTIVFVEVKTMRGFFNSLNYLIPEDQFSYRKFQKISRACMKFAAKHPNLINDQKGWRIDLIAINLEEGDSNFHIRHYENISQ